MSEKIYTNCYIPLYVESDLKWYERDGLTTYIDQIKYENFTRDRNLYLKNAKIVNFDIIRHACRGDKLNGIYKQYKTVVKNDLDKMSSNHKKEALGTCMRSSCRDLHIKQDLMLEYFKSL